MTTKRKRHRDGYKRVVDNKMRDFGDTDFEKKRIRVNKSKKKNKKKGDIIDTIVHEETHRKHPKMYERTVRKKTKKILGRISKRTKQRLYSRFRKRK